MAELTAKGIEIKSETKKLKRELTLLPLFAMIYFTVCGGSFGAEPMVGLTGPGMALILFIVTPILFSIPNMLMVREMNSLMPHEGGYYHWVKQAFGPFAGFLAGWMNWVVAWVDVSIYPVWAATYLAFFIPALDTGLDIGNTHIEAWVLQWVVALILIWLVSLLNIRGAKFTGIFSSWMGLVMIIPLILLSGVGIYNWIASGVTIHLPLLPQGAPPTSANLFKFFSVGLFVAMWNFMGWELPTAAGSEIVKPKRTYPLAMVLVLVAAIATYALPTIGGLYGGAGDNGKYLLWGQEPVDTVTTGEYEKYMYGTTEEELVAQGIDPAEETDQNLGMLMQSEYGIEKSQVEEWGSDPDAYYGWEFTDIARVVGEKAAPGTWFPSVLGILVTISAVLSMVGLFIGNGLGGTRVPFAMAEDGMMPKFLVKVHPKYGTPWVSIVICGIIFSILSLQTFSFLVVVDVFLNVIVLMAEIFALWVMRFKRPDLPRQKVPGGYVGLIYMTLCPLFIIVIAIISQITDAGLSALWLALGAIGVGIILYFPIRYITKKGVPDVDPFVPGVHDED
jgi:amino acid transporter